MVPARFLVPLCKKIYNRVPSPIICFWDLLNRAHCEKSEISKCFMVFKRTTRDKYTLFLTEACSNGLALREGRITHGLSMIYGVEGDSLIDFHGKCEDIKCAGKVFDGLRCVTTESSNFGDLLKAKCVFDEEPVSTWNAMIKRLVRLGELKSARILFDEMPERNKVSFTTMIDGYAEAGDMVAARWFFDELPEKDLFSWSALILGYVQNGRLTKVIKIFPEMWAMNVKPDESIMMSLRSACSQLGFFQLAKLVDSYMSGRADVALALLDVNAMQLPRNMETMGILIEKMPKRAFSSVMRSAHHVHCVLAVALFERMINEEGLRPDDVAFLVILKVCAYAGLVEDGCRFFDLMTHKYSIFPSPDHYECMVNLLVKSGKLMAAYELMKLTPVEPHFRSWGALLGACKLHCDADLTDEISLRQLIELIRSRSGDCSWDTLLEACKLHCDADFADEIRQQLIELITPRSVDCTRDTQTLLGACKLRFDTDLYDGIRWQLTELLRSRSVDCIWDTQHEDHSGGDPDILFTIHEEASRWVFRALRDRSVE